MLFFWISLVVRPTHHHRTPHSTKLGNFYFSAKLNEHVLIGFDDSWPVHVELAPLRCTRMLMCRQSLVLPRRRVDVDVVISIYISEQILASQISLTNASCITISCWKKKKNKQKLQLTRTWKCHFMLTELNVPRAHFCVIFNACWAQCAIVFHLLCGVRIRKKCPETQRRADSALK